MCMCVVVTTRRSTIFQWWCCCVDGMNAAHVGWLAFRVLFLGVSPSCKKVPRVGELLGGMMLWMVSGCFLLDVFQTNCIFGIPCRTGYPLSASVHPTHIDA